MGAAGRSKNFGGWDLAVGGWVFAVGGWDQKWVPRSDTQVLKKKLNFFSKIFSAYFYSQLSFVFFFAVVHRVENRVSQKPDHIIECLMFFNFIYLFNLVEIVEKAGVSTVNISDVFAYNRQYRKAKNRHLQPPTAKTQLPKPRSTAFG